MSAVLAEVKHELRVIRASVSRLPSIMEYSRRACEASPTWGPLGYNSVIWRNTLLDAFRDPTMVVLAAVKGPQVCGLLVGQRGPLPWCGGYGATDIVFVAERGGNMLLREFVQWCREAKVRRVDMGVSDTDIVDDEGESVAADILFRRENFNRAGRMYYQILEAAK